MDGSGGMTVAADRVVGPNETLVYQIVRLDEKALEAIRQIVREELARASPAPGSSPANT
jgi:hypothetical protein